MNLRIEQDDNYDMDSPRDWDNLGVMVCFHNRYDLGDKDHGYKSNHYNSMGELVEELQEHAAVILPLYLYDHGGISMRVGAPQDSWDSGQVGVIYVSKEVARKEYGWSEQWDRVTDGCSTRIIEKRLIAEVETYDQYLRGDVWGYIIEDDDGEEIESCWGFYGREYCEEEAKSTLEFLEKKEREAADELRRVQAAMPCCQP